MLWISIFLHCTAEFDRVTIYEDISKFKIKKSVFLELVVPYIVVLEHWDVAPEKLKLLDKKLGEGQFGIVKQGLLTTEEDDPEIVAAKTLKGTELVLILLQSQYFTSCKWSCY